MQCRIRDCELEVAQHHDGFCLAHWRELVELGTLNRLRDEFAMAYLTSESSRKHAPEHRAMAAYAMADLMLVTRSRRG